MDKKEIRKKMLGLRNTLSEVERAKKSAKIQKSLEDHEDFINADHILFYYTHGSEVDTIPLINKIIREKKVYLPKVRGENEFIAVPFNGAATLEKGAYNIPEPRVTERNTYERKLDLIIVPGVAFDKKGNRIGMGKGFYDRYLKGFPHVPKISLAFEGQVLESIQKEPYDVPVDTIITDENIY
jgi:5-formyltetrahydrofolate cyclo-ligase